MPGTSAGIKPATGITPLSPVSPFLPRTSTSPACSGRTLADHVRRWRAWAWCRHRQGQRGPCHHLVRIRMGASPLQTEDAKSSVTKAAPNIVATPTSGSVAATIEHAHASFSGVFTARRHRAVIAAHSLAHGTLIGLTRLGNAGARQNDRQSKNSGLFMRVAPLCRHYNRIPRSCNLRHFLPLFPYRLGPCRAGAGVSAGTCCFMRTTCFRGIFAACICLWRR